VGDVDVGGSVQQIAAGAYSSCGLLASGELVCWGSRLGPFLRKQPTDNASREALDTIGDDESPAEAGEIDTPPAAQLASSGTECLVLKNGKVHCLNALGPAESEFQARVVQVAVGRDQGCALMETGVVRCWNTAFGAKRPPVSEAIDVGGVVTQISSGNEHVCAVLKTGAVRCWGDGLDGKLGYGSRETIGDDETPASAGDVNVGGVVTQVSAGGWHTCALLATGAVRCWGRGALGHASREVIGDDEVPASVGDVDLGGKVKQIVTGFQHTCALLEGGTVRCWGDAYGGRLGYGNEKHVGYKNTPASAGDVPLWEPCR
jgi:alpha-tubulin suppressor-like RCC1 family protein